MPIPCQTFFLPPSDEAGSQALVDIAGAIDFPVIVVDTWHSETVTPLPGCDVKDALIYSVEDVLQELALERCYLSPGREWRARTRKELPIDIQAIDQRFEARVKNLAGQARQEGVPLSAWLRRGMSRQPGHRPFFDRQFKTKLVHLLGSDTAREMLFLAIHHVVRAPKVALVTGEPGVLQAGIRRARRLEQILPAEIDDFRQERGIPPSRREIRGLFAKAWGKVLRSEVTESRLFASC